MKKMRIFKKLGCILLISLPLLSTMEAKELTASEAIGAKLIPTISMLLLSQGNTVVETGVKKTGQTKSYDENGNEVTDGSLKDDGYYKKGVTPNYTRDGTKEIVTDHITGLMWQDNDEAATVTKPWLTEDNYDTCYNDTSSPACYDTSGDTAATYCANLALGGYDDWRLPTDKELEGIVNYGRYNPAIDTTFQHVRSGGYWSSTTYEGYKSYAWIVYFYYGNVYDVDLKGLDYYVRCVRDGQ